MKNQQQVITNVFGEEELKTPICTYRNCKHQFSLHGHTGKCQCHHPKAGGLNKK